MTKVYCCNFMKQIYQWFECRKSNWWSFLLYLIKLLLEMVGWKEQEPETKLSSTSNFQLPILKLVATFLVWAKTSSFNISHFCRSFNLVRHYDLQEKNLCFFMLEFPKTKRKFSYKAGSEGTIAILKMNTFE